MSSRRQFKKDRKLMRRALADIDELRVIRKASGVAFSQLEAYKKSRTRWMNAALAGVPIAALLFLALGIVVAHKVTRPEVAVLWDWLQ